MAKEKRGRGRPRKTNIPWIDVQNAYLMGEGSKEIAMRYKGLTSAMIRNRACVEKWPTPRNLKKKLIEKVNSIRSKELRGELTPAEANYQIGAVEQFRETLAVRQQAHRDTIEGIVKSSFGKHKLPPIKSWRDADIADKMARRSMDMDKEKPDSIINVGILHGGGVVDNVPAVDPPDPQMMEQVKETMSEKIPMDDRLPREEQKDYVHPAFEDDPKEGETETSGQFPSADEIVGNL